MLHRGDELALYRAPDLHDRGRRRRDAGAPGPLPEARTPGDRSRLSPRERPALQGEWLRLRFHKARDGCTTLPATKRTTLRIHDLRHTCASLLVASGVSIFDTSKVLGHADVRMTMRYAHFSPEAGRKATKSLESKLDLNDTNAA